MISTQTTGRRIARKAAAFIARSARRWWCSSRCRLSRGKRSPAGNGYCTDNVQERSDCAPARADFVAAPERATDETDRQNPDVDIPARADQPDEPIDRREVIEQNRNVFPRDCFRDAVDNVGNENHPEVAPRVG